MSAALDLLAGLVLENGSTWGDVATEWQWSDARSILEPGRFGPRMHFLTRPRSGSKTTDLAGVCCAALVEQLPPGGRCYCFATDRDQARLLVDALAGLVGRTPGLRGAIKVDRFQASTPAGAMLEVISSDAPSAYGLKGHLFICDEVTMWPTESQALWTAVLSATPKVTGARLVCLSSAGDPAHWSFKVRERARTSRRWRLHEVPGPVPWVDPEDLAEQRAMLLDSQYARLHENRWVEGENRLVSLENLTAAVTLPGPSDPQRGVRYAMGLDLGFTHDRTALCVAHAEQETGGERRVVLDRMVTFEGTPENPVRLAAIEEAVVALWRAYHRPRLRLDPAYATDLLPNLRRRGVSFEKWGYSAQRYGQIASVLYALLRDGRLALYADAGLLDELANVRLENTDVPGLPRIQHDSGRHDDRCVALGMAAVPLVERPAGGAVLHVPPDHLRVPRTVPPPIFVKSEDGPAVPVIDADGQTRKTPPARDRIGQLIPPGLRARRGEGYVPPGAG